MRTISNLFKREQPQVTRKIFTRSGGTFITPDTCMEVAAFYRGIIYISTQIAKLPWNVKDLENNIAPNHRAYKMLRSKPTDELNTFRWRLFIIQQSLIWGNGYSAIVRDMAGRPTGMIPLLSFNVSPYRNEDDELLYRVGTGTSGSIILKQRDIFHLANFHTKDGIFGQSIIDFSADTLGTAKGADNFANSLYANGAIPSGVLKADKKLNEAAGKRLKESWDDAHKGKKGGGTALLEEGIDYQSISMNPEVLQMLESRQFSVQEISRFLGVPPTKLFDTTASTFDNIENSNLEVVTDTLDAWARNLEAEADDKILNNNHGGYSSELDLRAVFRGDMKTRSDYFRTRMTIGSMSPNEIRKEEGDAPIEGGDRYFVETNNLTPLNRIDDEIDSRLNNEPSTLEKTLENKLKS